MALNKPVSACSVLLADTIEREFEEWRAVNEVNGHTSDGRTPCVEMLLLLLLLHLLCRSLHIAWSCEEDHFRNLA
jgi:hypothetical protein